MIFLDTISVVQISTYFIALDINQTTNFWLQLTSNIA